MNGAGEKTAAIALVVMATVAGAWLGIRQMELRGELAQAREKLEQVRNAAAEATLNNIALPTSRKLSVCNHGHEPGQITALATIYAGANGDLHVFNSARDGWRTWDIPARSEQTLQPGQPARGWNGEALFYAMDVAGARSTQLLAGTADNLARGCIALPGRHEGENN
jgi:hypothetical protein